MEFIVKEVKADESAAAVNNSSAQPQSSSANDGKTVSFDDNVTVAEYGPALPNTTSTGTGMGDTGGFGDYGTSGGAEKNCPICTMLNPVSASFCTACYTDF